jgi:glycosyltransferase involved in cell wall biosynthesis
MIKPKVSMVMPTYNRSKYSLTAVRCFMQQVYEGDLELIIVDDGTDKLDFSQYDARIRHIHLGTRTPTGTKRNIGAQAAFGDIIANLDDDDWSHPYRITDEVRRLLKTGKAVTGYNASIMYDEATKQIYKIPGGPPYFASGSSQLYMKSWWDLHPYPDCSFGEDSVFSRTARLADELAIAEPGKMMVIRRHSSNTSEIYLPKLPKLQPQDVSAEFWKTLRSSLPLGLYITEPPLAICQSEADSQYEVSVVDYKVDRLPEIITR